MLRSFWRAAACLFSSIITLGAAEFPRGLDLTGTDVQKLTLSDAIEMMLHNNLEVKFNRVDIKVEQARTRFATGVFDPVFKLEVSRESRQIPDLTSNVTSADSVLQQQNQFQFISALLQASGQPVPTFQDFTQPQLLIFDQDVDRWDSSLTFRTPLGTQLAVSARESKIRSTFFGDNRIITPYVQAFGGLEVRQPLLKDFGPAANLNDVRSSRINEEVARLTWQKSLQEGLGSVLSNYFDMLFAQGDLRTKQDAIAADEKLVQQNQRRSELGFMSPIDVQQARAQVSLDQEQLISSKNIFMERQFALRRLITSAGRDGASRIFLPVQTSDLSIPSLNRTALLQTAFQRRPDYLATVTSAKVQDIRLAFAKNQLWPNLDLVGTYGYNGLDQDWQGARDQAWHSQAPQWSFGVQFSMPLGRVQSRAQYDAIKGLKEQAILKIAQSELTVTVDVDTALSRIETNRQRLSTARQTRELNEEAVRIGYRRMEEGQISSFDLIETQRKLYDAKARELAAQAELNKSIATLWQVTGTIADELGITIVAGKRSRDLPEATHTPKQTLVKETVPAKKK
jgi:outer membrane protein TolC